MSIALPLVLRRVDPSCRSRSVASVIVLALSLVSASLPVPSVGHAQESTGAAPAVRGARAAEPAASPLSSLGGAGSSATDPGPAASSVLFGSPPIAAATAPPFADIERPLLSVEASDGGSRGQFFLFALGLVAGGAALYKIGDATGVGIVESTGAFVAGAGLLAIVIPVWLVI